MLVSVGERISISLLAMALDLKKQEAISFTGSQCGIITTEDHSEAKIVDVKPHRILPHLEKGKVVIVAGFQGVSKGGNITTLGRGGSDTTAVALAAAFQAEKVEFFKDVPGVFSEDPKRNTQAQFLPQLSHSAALEIMQKGAKVLHARSIELAQKNGMSLHVRPFENYNDPTFPGTLIGDKNEFSIPIYEEFG